MDTVPFFRNGDNAILWRWCWASVLLNISRPSRPQYADERQTNLATEAKGRHVFNPPEVAQGLPCPRERRRGYQPPGNTQLGQMHVGRAGDIAADLVWFSPTLQIAQASPAGGAIEKIAASIERGRW